MRPLTGKRGLGVAAGALAKGGGVGALDDHGLEVDLGDLDPPDPFPGLTSCSKIRARASSSRRLGRSPASLGRVGGLGDVGAVEESLLEGLERVAGPALLDRAVDRRDRLLPGERHRNVDRDHDSGGDQGSREDVQSAAQVTMIAHPACGQPGAAQDLR